MKDRHQCEVRHILALRAKNRQSAIDYIERAKSKRGDTGLERDAAEQWAMGNRGEWGRWEVKAKEAA